MVVSVLHIWKGSYPRSRSRHLDEREVETITAFLFHRGGHNDPARLATNVGRSFQGSIVLGMGFTFNDTDTSGIATPLAEMERLLAQHPHYREAISPYIGGEEVNSSPTHAHRRYAIDFGEVAEAEARRRYPELMAIVEAKVKPERMAAALRSKSSHGKRAAVWWQHYHHAKELYAAIASLDQVLVICRHQPHWATTAMRAASVFAGFCVKWESRWPSGDLF